MNRAYRSKKKASNKAKREVKGVYVEQSRYIALGLMSGTSLDGVDAAFLETDGERIFRLGPSLCSNFSCNDKAALQMATQDALTWQFSGPKPESFETAEAVIHKSHVKAVKTLCNNYPEWARELAMIGLSLIHI